jgi:uroporphyrinogen-III synthase
MYVLVTRPEPAAERTAAALVARGHQAWKVPLLRVESLTADLSGGWSGVIVTSANAPAAARDNPALLELPVFAVGDSSAEASI